MSDTGPERRPELPYVGFYNPPYVGLLGAFAELTCGNGGEVHADGVPGSSHSYTD
jgi:hypothetical protein